MENEEKKSMMSYINDEQFRSNAETAVAVVAAILVVIITKGFISGFSWDLFLTLEPYASGIGVGVAASILHNNMITRGVSDEILDNEELSTLLDEVSDLDEKITDYDYADYFIEQYNIKEFERLQKLATDKATRSLKYAISIKKSLGRKYDKLQRKLDYVIEYGATVKGYHRVTLQDLLSFQASNELKGKDKINFQPIATQRKGLLRSQIVIFLASGAMAGLPLASGKNGKEVAAFLAVWIPLLFAKALRTYIRSRKITKTTYFKSLQYKKNVLKLCLDAEKHYTPPKEETFNKEEVVEVKEIENNEKI